VGVHAVLPAVFCLPTLDTLSLSLSHSLTPPQAATLPAPELAHLLCTHLQQQELALLWAIQSLAALCTGPQLEATLLSLTSASERAQLAGLPVLMSSLGEKLKGGDRALMWAYGAFKAHNCEQGLVCGGGEGGLLDSGCGLGRVWKQGADVGGWVEGTGGGVGGRLLERGGEGEKGRVC